MATTFEEMTIERDDEAEAPQVHQLQLRVDRLQGLLGELRDLRALSGQTADRVFGPVPIATDAKPENVTASGVLEKLDQKIDSLHECVSRCLENVIRLSDL